MKRYLILLAAMWLVSGSVISQNDNLGFGFRAGASIAKLDGPSELGPNGEELEEYTMARGFHIGASVSYKFTDLVGMKAEFVYSQRGTEYKYDGPSYYVLGRRTLRTTTINGNREQTLDLSNVFLDIPVMAYYKIGKLELCGGVNTGEASSETFDVSIDGSFPYTVPETVMAYYEFETKVENQYKTLDFGLVVGAAFYVNEGLYFSARYNHGLSDADVNTYDVSLQSLNTDGSFKYRDDDNRSRSWQFSVGFSF